MTTFPKAHSTLADRLKEVRTAHRLTQAQTAEALGIHRSTYTYYESGRSVPPLKTLKQLSVLLDTPLSVLCGTEDEAPALHLRSEDVPEPPKTPSSPVNPQEEALLALFRLADDTQRRNALRALMQSDPEKP